MLPCKYVHLQNKVIKLNFKDRRVKLKQLNLSLTLNNPSERELTVEKRNY